MLWTANVFAIAAFVAVAACDRVSREAVDLDAQDRTPAVPTTPATGVRLAAVETPEFGRYLTDSEGRPLYVLSADSTMTSTCVELCAQEWPPVPARQPPAEAGGPGVDAGLIGSTLRQDGRLQVTYAGRPLYYRNAPAVSTSVQPFFTDQWGQWSLIRPSGDLVAAKGQAVIDVELPRCRRCVRARRT